MSTHALANAAYKGRKESPITINNLLMSNQKKGAKLANTPDVLPDIISPNFTDEDSAANNKSAKYRNRGESK